jgi:histidinol dehydrogenase
MARRLDFHSANFAADFDALLDSKRESDSDVHDAVASIIADIRNHGDQALLALTAKFDNLHAETVADLAVGQDEMAAALNGLDADLRAALELAGRPYSPFSRKTIAPRILPIKMMLASSLACALRRLMRQVFMCRVARPAYPSSVLMNAIPAMVAGVKRRVMVVPARDGEVNPLVLAAASLAGVSEVWRIGGAQAVAALAYGTQTIGQVDKIVGPGNAFVAAAKRQVFGQVGIDSIAGPSEILVVADAQNDPNWIAADLLSQAEHDEAAQSILITDDADFADAVEAAVQAMLPQLERAAVAGRSWADNGAIITVPSMDAMPALANRIAAEHLELALDDAAGWSGKIRHAGAMFLGRYTPEAIGDYVAGPNHVLPTARTARFSSGLGVADFMKRTTIVACDADGFAAIAPSGVALADAEGLGAHALSMRIRMNR